MHAEDALGPAAAARDLRDRDRGGVACDTQPSGTDRLELRQHAPLDPEVLEHGFDHEIRAREAREVEAGRDPVHALRDLARGEAPALQALVVDRTHLPEPSRERVERFVLDPRRDARLRGDARDPRAHQPRAHDPELRDVRGERSLRHARVLLDLLGREEDRHERARHVGHREPAELARLEREAFGERRRGALLHDLERRQRRRVVAARLLDDRAAGLREDERPQRLLVERDPGPLRAEPPFGERVRSAPRRAEQHRRSARLVHQPRAQRARRLERASREDQVERRAAAPTSRGSRCVPPAPGMIPSCTSGSPISVFGSSEATR